MKAIPIRIAVILLYLVVYIPAIAQDSRGIIVTDERLALVIGNNAYQGAQLNNPVNDADDMGRVLSTLGFRVMLLKNVDRRAMEDAIRSFGQQLRNGGVGLFYFAGHGMQVEGRNYLIPINARIESESDIKYEAVDAGFVLGKMEDAKNQLNIVVLDACRNNPYSRNFRASEKGLARMNAPAGSLIAYSTAPGSIAADGEERNGIFTKHLIRHMQTPNLTVELLLKRVRIDVAAETKQRQIPWESSSLMGDFYFRIEKAPESAGVPPSSPPPTPPKEPLASIQKPEAIDSKASVTKQSLAIFPIYFSNDGKSPPPGEPGGIMYYGGTKKATIEYLKELMINNKKFSPVYSYYELPKETGYRKIPTNILNEKVVGDLWLKEGFFSTQKKPNISLIVELGRKLDVDNVLIIDCGFQSIGLYIIEVNQQKVFFKNGDYSAISGYTEVPKQLKGFLSTYKRYLIK